LLLDGRRINASQIVTGYIAEITVTTGQALRPPGSSASAPELVVRNWYNPNLDYNWFTLPGMIAVITTVLVLSVSVQAIAREREFDTYDQLMALPMRRWEILLGKAVPAFLVGLFNGAFYTAMVALVSDVPLHGSYWWSVLALAAFSLAVSSIGLAISSVAANQQQAFLGGFLVIVPMILLSGYASPVDGMPAWLQPIAAIDPLTHLLAVCHGVFLKDLPPEMIVQHIWPMLLVAGLALTLAHTLLHQRTI
jgi:ABC-2 type transport system permease protein